MNNRQKAILKKNIFLGSCAVVLVLAIVAVILIIVSATKGEDKDDTSTISSNISSNVSSDISSNTSLDTTPNTSSKVSSNVSSDENNSSVQTSLNEITSSLPSTVTFGEYTLDATYQNLLLVNAKNPLPEDYDYVGELVTIPEKYIKGSLTQINKNILPYLLAMLDDALNEGIDIGVWSPYRSYTTQQMLFNRQVEKQIDSGVPKSKAEDKAATVVARPGTSEHHTGLALDINSASASFENTDAYKWLKENAENYGFIMRYSKEKQDITGVIHESWHWRFVGINTAKEINRLGMCLEEYIEYKK